MSVPLRVGHSPDADDAFMFYGIAKGVVDTAPYVIEHVIEDIQALNERAMRGDLEVTAISAAVYPQVAGRYRILACGASIGRGYGPIVLARPGEGGSIAGRRIAIPGEHTTAYLLLRIFERDFVPAIMGFDEVLPALDARHVDGALVIHEGQVTYKSGGYESLVDLGVVWERETGLPIPLGLDVVRRDLGEDAALAIYRALRDSILHTNEDEEGAIDYALRFGRGIDRETCRTFVRMYVNRDTVQMGDEGRRALDELYGRALRRGLISEMPPLDIVGLEAAP